MTVSVLIIAHDDIGSSLVTAATKTLGELPLPTTAVTVSFETDPDELLQRLQRLVTQIDAQDGVLVLTDLYGSTPCNIAAKLQTNSNIKVISGLNLSMLIRIMNYPQLSLLELAQKALSGGKDGVINCSENKTC